MPPKSGRFHELVARTRALNAETQPQLRPLDEVLRASASVAHVAVLRHRITAGAGGVPPVPEDASQITEDREGAKFTIPLVLPEGLESGDGRSFAKGALSRRELPLPLMWQIHTSDGHDGSVVVGRIDQLDRTDSGMGNAYGCFDTGPYGQEAERLVRSKMLRFVSADLDKFEADAIKPDELSEGEEPGDDGHIAADRMIVTKGRVMGVTLVAKPAFQECTIQLADEGVPQTESADGVYEEPGQALAASAATLCAAVPIHPPRTWFNNPELQQPTAITVDDSGHVYGHIASWDMDHIGMPFGTRVPTSRSKYAYFHTGVIRTEDGDDVPVGQLTLSGGHAPLSANAAAAMKHYDDTRSAVADVRAGEDAYGVWVAGALRPDVTPEQVRSFRASSPSGDWRQIKGALELVAVCQVNVPGFPVARAQVASGAVLTLVAAGARQLSKLQTVPVNPTEARLRRLEASEQQRDLAKLAQLKSRVDPLLEARRESNAARLALVKSRMTPIVASARERDRLALLAAAQASRSRLDQAFGVDEYVNSFKNFSPERREQLAKKKHALPDGSFPIENEKDLGRAIQAHGRAGDDKKAAVKRHIVKRARALGKPDKIPSTWSENELSLVELLIADAKESRDV